MIPGGSNSLISSNGCLTYHLPPRPCYCALIISSLYLFRPINVIQSKIYISKLFLFLFFSILFRLIMSCSLPLNKDLNEERNLTSIRILMGAGKCSTFHYNFNSYQTRQSTPESFKNTKEPRTQQ